MAKHLILLFSLLLFVHFTSKAQEDSIRRISIDTPAGFPGGNSALNRYLKENMHFPQEALDLGIQGKCYVSFVIEEDGSVSNVKLVRGIPDCHECDKEAIRLIKEMPKWVPATRGGIPVQTTYSTYLNFRLY